MSSTDQQFVLSHLLKKTREKLINLAKLTEETPCFAGGGSRGDWKIGRGRGRDDELDFPEGACGLGCGERDCGITLEN